MADHTRPPFLRYDDLRRRILDGEDAQITIESVTWQNVTGDVTYKPVGQLRFRTNNGRWQSKPAMSLYANPKNGPEDPASIVESYGRWLVAGRDEVGQ